MKRHIRLAPLSHEHHTALRLGRHLPAGGTQAELGAELPGLEAHFAEDEHEFFPVLATSFEEQRP